MAAQQNVGASGSLQSHGDIRIVEAQEEDMTKLFTIASRAFNVNEPFWDAMFPRHDTEQGRINGGLSFSAARKLRQVRYIKAVDHTDKIVGFARWFVYKDDPEVPTAELKPGPLFHDDTELEYAREMTSDFIKTRAEYVRQSNGNVVCLDILAIDPDHQRKGIGGKLVSWGTALADELNIDAVVESSVFGKALYQKHGYVFLRYVEIRVSEKFPDPKTGFAWLVRERDARQ